MKQFLAKHKIEKQEVFLMVFVAACLVFLSLSGI